ncbi:uncharacterized protein LOC143889483 [Tasmannia lanceolata]|uniref:uncharacterized protein LOC143889483 n=1 Tax=Tasmannia lanceolata TaxID=3420 RepID=UPI0040638997
MATFVSIPRVSAQNFSTKKKIKKKMGSFMYDKFQSLPSLNMEKKNSQKSNNTDKKKDSLFDFPLRVYCVSSMSKQQRLETANLLKYELKQVRSLLDGLNNKILPQKPTEIKVDPMNSNQTTASKKQKSTSKDRKDLNPKNPLSLFLNRSRAIRKKETLPISPLKKPKVVNSKRTVAENRKKETLSTSPLEKPKVVNSRRTIVEKPSDYYVGVSEVNNEDYRHGSGTYEDCPPGFEAVRKRKRELDREAARLALHKMEETVSIYDDYQFLKDLQMLGIVQSVRIRSSLANEMRCFISHDNMVFFERYGRSSLEKLGLYMKVEDDNDYQGNDYFGVDREEGEFYRWAPIY